MLYICIFNAKEGTLLADINHERKEWFKKGRDQIFQDKCKKINRYEVIGSSPLKILFVIETDDTSAVNLLSRHFGDAWNAVTYPVIERELQEALEEDHAIVAG
jgi:hypothetical protein